MPETLREGERVEVRTRFDALWAKGFELIAVEGDHVRVRRVSDGEELPVAIARADVRRERRGGTLWWM